MAYKAYFLLARAHARKACEAITLVGPMEPYYPEDPHPEDPDKRAPLLYVMRIQARAAIANRIAKAVRAIDGARATPADLAHGPRGSRLWDPVKEIERKQSGRDFVNVAKGERGRGER